MFLPDLSTTVPVATFSLVSQRATSSLRADPAMPLEEPRTLTISHETQKNGRVASVIYIDDLQTVTSSSVLPTLSSVRLQLKLQYNPTEGRTDLDTVIPEIYAQLKEILTTANLTKFLNKEH